MTNAPQTRSSQQNPQGQQDQKDKDQYTGQSKPDRNNPNATGRVGNNMQKDEPLARRQGGGKEDEGDSCSVSSDAKQANENRK